MNVFELFAKISLDTSDFEKGIKNVSKESKSVQDSVKDMSKNYENAADKMKELSEAYEETAKNAGENVDEVKDLGKEIDKTGKEADEAKDNLDDFSDKARQSGNSSEEATPKISKLAESLKKGLAAAAKVSAAALGAATTAVAGLTKAAVSSYADYEQLAGGVETLFGTGGKSIEEYAASVGKTVDEVRTEYNNLEKAQTMVLDNAAKAYTTAGMSQNEYMETVTGFAAALTSSLEGDTEKAASVADMAVQDMSDNANKMGYFSKKQPMLKRLKCWNTLRAA